MDRTVNVNGSRTSPRHRQHRIHLNPLGETPRTSAKESAHYWPESGHDHANPASAFDSWVTQLTRPLFVIGAFEVTGRAIILVVGGLFLLVKSTHEIHDHIEGEDQHRNVRAVASLFAVLVQITLLDIVFSLDSVITAVGMVDQIAIMIIAVILAIIVMMIFANPVSDFVECHPTIKMLALSFLLLIGVNLIAEGLGFHIPRGYTYFAMAFSLFVEMLNLKMRSRKPVPRPLQSRRLQKAIGRIKAAE